MTRTQLFKYTSTSLAAGAGDTDGSITKCSSGRTYNKVFRVKAVVKNSQRSKFNSEAVKNVKEMAVKNLVEFRHSKRKVFNKKGKMVNRKIRGKRFYEFQLPDLSLDLCEIHKKVDTLFSDLKYVVEGFQMESTTVSAAI